MDYKEIRYEVKEHVGVITLNRPEAMNALTLLTHEELTGAIGQAAGDDDVRVIVLTGAGKAFCAGDDVKKIFLKGGLDASAAVKSRAKMLQGDLMTGGGHRLLEINKPTIAAVNGVAVGYGCDLSLLCNMRVASEKARFGEVFLRVGLVPGEAMILLPRLVGLAKAYEMVLTADIIDAREAEKIGLVNKVVPHEELMPAAMDLAAKITKKPPIAVQLAMEGIRRGLDLDMKAYMQFNSMAFSLCSETEDFIEGSKAFAEKREPVFKGR